MELRRILFPIDFSEPNYAASPLVCAMATRFHAQVILLNVVPLPFRMCPDEAALGVPVDVESLRHDLSPALDGAFQRELAHLEVERVLDLGEAPEAISRFADTQGVDLIMMPTWGHGPFRRLLLGSTTAKVVHDAQCPVWTSPHVEFPLDDPDRDYAWRVVLCAVDGTPESSPVMEWAAQFCGAVGAKLRLVHVLNDSGNWSQTKPDIQWQKRLHKDALAAIECVQRTARVNAPASVVTGKISQGVCEEAEKRGAQVLVVGRGMVHDTAGRLGKHAHEILRSSPCPVIAV